MAWQGSYTSFGEVQVSIARIRQPFRLLGQYEDEETGLYYNFARYYSPTLASYLSRDPKWFLPNASNYSYCAGDPWNRVDVDGEAWGWVESAMDSVASAARAVKDTVTDPAVWRAVGEVAVDVAVVAGSIAAGAAAVALAPAALGVVATGLWSSVPPP